jgi:hypothetical protein
MANEGFVEGVMAVLTRSVADELRDLGPAVEADIVELVSVPVQYAGSEVIRSRPGEPPRRETGIYRDSIRHEVIDGEAGPDSATLHLFTNSVIGTYLEYGTSAMKPRPHFGPTFEAWRDEVVRRVGDAVFRAGPPAPGTF